MYVSDVYGAEAGYGCMKGTVSQVRLTITSDVFVER